VSTNEDPPAFGGGNAPVEIFMAENVACVPKAATVRDAARALLDNAVGALVVGTPDAIDGVLSERDILRAVADGLDLDTVPASDVDTHTIVWCDRTSTVAEVTELMMEKYVRHVLVEEGGVMVGIVSARDLLGAYAT
jgi:CBS domain-containing protein